MSNGHSEMIQAEQKRPPFTWVMLYLTKVALNHLKRSQQQKTQDAPYSDSCETVTSAD